MRAAAEMAPDPDEADALGRALSVLAETQGPEGSWKGDYGGPLFLVPVYVAGLHFIGQPFEPEVRDGLIEHLRVHQYADGGWGLDVESHSHVFTSVLNYVAMRLLGVAADDPALQRAKAWFLPLGGPLASGSWGKFILALLGLYDWEGLDPLPPELWLLPKSAPLHPSRLWCHCRMVYLPMSWLYGRRATAEFTPLIAAVREEIYPEPYERVDWPKQRGRVAPTDAYTPRGPLLKTSNLALGLVEKVMPGRLRQKALDEVLAQIDGEDRATSYICIGPINKVLNTVVWHVAKPGGPEVKSHLERLPDYLYRAADGVKVNGYNSSELWDTAFAVQALVASGRIEEAREALDGAAEFIEANQVLEDSPEHERFYRHPSRGGWPFSTRAHGWPISDCTAEGLKASLLLEPLGLDRVPRHRKVEAVELILSMQNGDGGWATYELTRGGEWLEQLNPSDVFSTIMVDVGYVECTSACVQALSAWRATGTAVHRAKVDEAIAEGEAFIRRKQRSDGSWEGSWGVCFSYGTWFGVKGLLAAGADADDPALTRAAEFLRAHQRADGAWSELAESCRKRAWVEGETGHAVNTAWALLSLAAVEDGKSREAIRRGVAWLKSHQLPNGRWPDEPLAGVFNRTCAIHYDAYRRIFPLWALAICDR